MPKVEKAPKELNDLLEKVYASALKEYDGDKGKASATAWKAAKSAGWRKVKGKWTKTKKAEHSVPVKDHILMETGTFKTKSGEVVNITEKDFDEMCETFNPDEPPAYIPGHTSDWPGTTMIPKLGEIKGTLKRVGNKLMAIGAEFTDRLAGWIREGFYDQRSCETYKENGKMHLGCIAMLGMQPPAIKGMPPINADMLQSDLMFSKPTGLMEFAEGSDVTSAIGLDEQIDVVEQAGKDSTKKDIAECLAELQNSLEEMVDEEEEKDRMIQEVYEHVNDLCSTLNIHDAFMERLEDLEENEEGEYAKKKGFWYEFAEYLKNHLSTNKQKESIDMDKELEAKYQKQIADLENEKKEFAEKVRVADEAKAKEAEKTADTVLHAEIHQFCETNKLNTNKHKEMKIEDILFASAKANQTIEFAGKDKDGKDTIEKKPLLAVLQDTLKSFQIAQPTEGEMTEFSQSLSGDKKENAITIRIKQAEEYVRKNPAEFSGSDIPNFEQKVARALQLETNKQITFKPIKE
jgi:hypothetical protein